VGERLAGGPGTGTERDASREERDTETLTGGPHLSGQTKHYTKTSNKSRNIGNRPIKSVKNIKSNGRH
jgi:hypothetical protein